MPPSLALFLWFILLMGLLYFDPAKDSRTSPALWVPVIWMFIIGSRLPSQWLGGQMGQAAQALEEGNPLDRSIYSVLILLAIGILMSRSFKWGVFFARNSALTAVISYTLLSVLWSDFPFVAFKRWFRDLGNYLTILVVLSDPLPLEAIRTLLRRLCYLLVPLSVLLIKYYPQIGIGYSTWTGAPEYAGVATSKNTLGFLCLISGLFLFWDTMTRWAKRKEGRTRRILAVNFAFMAMTLWLLHISNSATSRVCLMIGSLVILVVHSGRGKRYPAFLKAAIPAGICLYLMLAFGFGIDINGALAGALGRDATFTGRTVIWSTVLSTHTNPLLGSGYESFWLGPRLKQVWQLAGPVNEAHNGYLDVYLNLGLIGLFLLCGLLVSSYRAVCRDLTTFSSLASLSLALWTIAIFYNVTEASFKAPFMCLTFLLGTLAVPRGATVRGVPAKESLLNRPDGRRPEGAAA